MGPTVGNRVVTSLVARQQMSVTQRLADPPPADVAAQAAFNPLDKSNQLVRAINQSDFEPDYP